jgi:hypothetical protein
MPLITSLANKLAAQYPQFAFTASDTFSWSPTAQCIRYDVQSDDCQSLVHELAHAILTHDTYRRDIELISMEREAWSKAKKLGTMYGISIEEDFIQDSLDTYRNWLHARSTCPNCAATGLQQKGQYTCIACGTGWKANDARICELRRYVIKNTP